MKAVTLGIAIVVLAAVGEARADLIFSREWTIGVGTGELSTIDAFQVVVTSQDPIEPIEELAIFAFDVRRSQLGELQTVKIEDQLGAQLVAERITDGEYGFLEFLLWKLPNGGAGNGNDEPYFFADGSLNGIDLGGYEITSFGITIDRIDYATGHDNRFDFVHMTFEFHSPIQPFGVVPEPASASLMMIGGAAAIGFRRRRQRKLANSGV